MRAAVILCLAACLAMSCGVQRPVVRAASTVVGVSGPSLTLDNKPWWPVGINVYQMGTDWSVNTGCGVEVDPDLFFSRLPAHTLVRVNAFARMAVNKYSGKIDFSALDAVFDAAARHRQLLIVVLTANGGGCENGHFKDFAWFSGGWSTSTSHDEPMTYADWVTTAVTRWRDSPAIAGWSPVGEPEPSNCGDSQCSWPNRGCPDGAAAAVRTFFDAVGARIRALDPGALLFSGHAGGSQCGSAGADFATVGASAGIDVLEYHFYVGTDDLDATGDSGLPRRIDQARALGKPLLIAELGMPAGSCASLAQRRMVLGDTTRKMRERGAAGVLFWTYMPEPAVAGCTLDIGPDDPLFAMVGNAL